MLPSLGHGRAAPAPAPGAATAGAVVAESRIASARADALLQRLRATGSTGMAIVVMFLALNSLVREGPAAPYFALLVGAFVVLALLVGACSRPGFGRNAESWTILCATALSCLAAAAGVLERDLVMPSTVNIMLLLTTAAVLPWGVVPQASLVGFCGAVSIATASLVGARSGGDASAILLVNVLAGSLMSLVIARQNRTAFDAAARETLRWRTSEERRRRLNDELEAMVRERTAELEEALADQRDITRAISHDLRQPLRHIEGYARMIEDDLRERLDPENLERLGRVRAATVRTGRMVDSLLELSRMSGRMLRRRPFDLSRCARTLRDELQKSDPARRVTFEIEPNVVEDCDAALAHDLLRELLGNAWKFTCTQADARIAFGRRDGVLFVRDNGAGFDMRYGHRLFQAFERLHHAAEFEGEGVGLAIAERIVRSHGGRIWAESEPGRGASFLFTLQADRPPAGA